MHLTLKQKNVCVCVCTDLEVADGVDEQVGGFEVTVDDVGRVHILKATE